MMKNLKKFSVLLLALILVMNLMGISAFAEESQPSPTVTIDLTPGESTEQVGYVSETVGSGEIVRKITAVTSDVETVTKQTMSEFKAPQSALKFDRNSTADQKAQKKATETYTDNGHFTDPSTVIVEGAPEGYPWKYVGNGDYSGHYMSHIRVIFDRDENGNPKMDEDDNYIIKELQHASSGTPLHYNGELVTNPEGPFHFATGTRPQQFLLMNENGDTAYGYCIDLDTGAEGGKWYALANLEDNNYYASEEAENHVRGIVFNGYWGTESGTGSLASLKAALKEALKASNPGFDVEQDVTLVNRKEFVEGYELKEGEYHHGSYVYWSLPTKHVVLTDEIIDQMTEGEALDAMQAAIWSWANGSNATLDGTDRVIVGDLYASSSKLSDSLNGENDYEGAARTKALYQWLMQQTAEASTVIVNDKTFADDIALTVGAKDSNSLYNASLRFSISEFAPDEKDELSIELAYTDAEGNPATVTLPLTGENAVQPENGYYTIDGLRLAADVPFDFTLKIVGKQYLQQNAYIYTSEGGIGQSQTMVGMAEGYVNIDIAKALSSTFSVSESARLSGTKTWIDRGYQAYRPDSIVINLLANGEEIAEKTVSTRTRWNYSFEDLPIYDEDGNVIAYTITEDSVPGYETYIDGSNVTNTYIPPRPTSTHLSVTKKWEGDSAENRPESITVQLLRNGSVYDEVTLSAKNNWNHTWYGLDINSGWSATEGVVPENYTSSVSQTGSRVVITNTYAEELPDEDPPLGDTPDPGEGGEDIFDEEIPLADAPKTGDPSALMAAMSVVSGAGLFLLRKKRDEE